MTRSRCTSLLGLVAILAVTAGVSEADAQGELRGRAVTDSGRAGVRDARISLPRLGLATTSDTAGSFRITGIRAGEQVVVLQAAGFRPETVLVDVDASATTFRDFILRPVVTTLPEQRVSASSAPTGKMVGFYERRQKGVGRFLDAEMLARDAQRGMRPSDALAKVPGVTVVRAQGSAWIASGRAVGDTCGHAIVACTKEELDPIDRNSGAKDRCYLDVYMDDVKVYYRLEKGTLQLFDVNTLQLTELQGIEVYTSPAQVPVRYQGSGRVCGVMLIWTR
jgi:hypothetical protein